MVLGAWCCLLLIASARRGLSCLNGRTLHGVGDIAFCWYRLKTKCGTQRSRGCCFFFILNGTRPTSRCDDSIHALFAGVQCACATGTVAYHNGMHMMKTEILWDAIFVFVDILRNTRQIELAQVNLALLNRKCSFAWVQGVFREIRSAIVGEKVATAPPCYVQVGPSYLI